MINLLYIIEGGQPSGAEQNLLTIIKTINKTEYKVRVCLLQPSDILEDELRDLSISVFIPNITGKRDIFSIFKLIQFMRREKIDIVHSCLYLSNAIGRVAAILARVPVIIAWEQGEIFSQGTYYYNVNKALKVDRALASFSDCIVACCKACKDEIIKREGIPARKIRVIYNCINLTKFNASSNTSTIKEQLGIRPDEIVIGTIAYLYNEKKGQEYLIRAIPQITKVYPKMKLLLVGEGPSKSGFIQIIKNLNIEDRVILTGFRRDALEIMNALDLYVCPSIREGLSLSILEAMALKKPVVATSVGGNPEAIIEKQTGYLVPPKDINNLASAIINLLADREKMYQMGKAGFERVNTYFSSELIIKEIEALYKELLWKIHPKPQ